MSKYDLKFSVGIDGDSKNKFKRDIADLTKQQTVNIALNLEKFNEFQKTLSTGLSTTVKIRVDTSELEKALSKFNITDFQGMTKASDMVNKYGNERYSNMVSGLKETVNEYEAYISRMKRAERTILEFNYSRKAIASGQKVTDEDLVKYEENDKALNKAIDRFVDSREKVTELRRQITAEIAGLQSDDRFTTEKIKSKYKSLGAFNKSFTNDKLYEYFNSDRGISDLDGYKAKFVELRTELQNFTANNNIHSILDIDKLPIEKLSQAADIFQRMEKINEKIVELNDGNKRSALKYGASANETELYKYYKTAQEKAFENGARLIGIAEAQSAKSMASQQNISSSITAEAASDLYKSLSSGLNDIPINSFAVSPEAIESIKEQIQAQLSNITVGKTVTLTSNADEKTVQEKVVLPDVIIGSFELSTEAIAKLRADTQTALNNVSLEPSADETAFTEAFERVSKTYQSRLNALGRKLTKAIEKPTIEEFDAQPAIDKMKAQINNALKSFKFNIGGTVAGASISSKDAALVTREAIGSRINNLVNQLEGKYSNIQKYNVFPKTATYLNNLISERIADLQSLENNLFKTDDKTGKYTMSFDNAKAELDGIVIKINELNTLISKTGQSMPLLKTVKNIDSEITDMLNKLEGYEQTPSVRNLYDKIRYQYGGLWDKVQASQRGLPTVDIDKANNDILTMLQELEQVKQEFSEISKTTKTISDRDLLAKKAQGALNDLNGNYDKIRKLSIFPQEAKELADNNKQISDLFESFTNKVYAKGKKRGTFLFSAEELEEEFNSINGCVDTLNQKLSTLGQKMPIQKAFDSAKKSVENMLTELDKYQETDKIQAFRARLEGDSGLLARIKTSTELLPNEKAGIDVVTAEAIELDGIIKQMQQDFAAVTQDAPLTKELEKAEVDAMRVQKSIVNLQERMQKSLVANSKGFSQAQYKQQFDMIYEATKSDALTGEDVSMLTTKFKQLENSMRAAGMTGKSFGDVMRGMYAKFGSWTMVTMTIQRVIMTFKRMVAAVQEVDSALTNLRKVTDATEADLEKFMRGVGDSAHKLGATMSDLVNATAEFSRLGYDLNQSQKLGELATMYKSVAEDLDITTASQSIVSTLKAFEKAGISAERIVDVFNYVGNNFAISSAGIGEAMQRSAASLQTANNSLEQSVALITAA